MGNTASGEDEASMCLQSQDSEHLWTIERWSEDEFCEFIGSPSEGPKAILYQHAVQQLLKLRHPNILRFFSSHTTAESIVMTTELVVPLSQMLPSYKLEGLVKGWRDIATGLGFLHDPKLGISHNNVHVGNIFIGGPNSQWKIGGFEAALAHKDITPEFLLSVAPIRHDQAIPPEDKKRSASATGMAVHCRDMWALGRLILHCMETSQLLVTASEQLLLFVNSRMLSKAPQARPTCKELVRQPWMRNNVTVMVDFLSNLVLKDQKQKDVFFSSLALQLHSVPSDIVANHVVPLLLHPLVMAEPKASSNLWMHLFCPASANRPHPEVFDPMQVCPLLPEDLYKSHMLPHIINLLANREYCVRSVLLKYFDWFAGLCEHDDLTTIVLPEILVGMRDDHDELVAATLSALATLVPLLGASVVMGTSRKRVFTDVQPRKATAIATPTDSHLTVSPPTSLTAPPSSAYSYRNHRSREERAEMMRLKREEQKRKRKMGPKERLGVVTTSEPPVIDNIVVDIAPEEASGEAQPEKESAHSPGETSPSDCQVEEEKEDEWQGFEANARDWGSGWTKDEEERGKDSPLSSPSSSSRTASSSVSSKVLDSPSVSMRSPTITKPKGMQLLKPHSQNHSSQSHSVPELTQSTTTAVSNSYKLSKEDTARLEEQFHWAAIEPDLFADMAPIIIDASKLSLPLPPPGENGHEPERKSHKSLVPSLDYQPQEGEAGEGWDDGWGNYL